MIAVILAAGEATRFGSCKQLEPIDGVPMLAHVIRQLPDHLTKWVIVGDRRGEVETLVQHEGATPRYNPDYKVGMTTSVRLAAQIAIQENAGLLLTLGDLPFVSTEDYELLLESYSEQPLFSEFSNQIGPPALIPNQALSRIVQDLKEGGMKSLFDRPSTVSLPNAAKDIDTPSDLR